MGNLTGHTRPAHIVGEVIFTSYDGLRAESNGVLDFLTFDQRLLEMRSAGILAALPAYSTANYGIIIQELMIDRTPYWVIGAVRKIKDFNKRPGILGSAICIERNATSLDGIDTYLFDVLQSNVDDTFEDSWKGKPLPRKLNLLPDVPQREVRADYRSKPDTELAYVSEGISLASAMEATMLGVRYSTTVGRAIVLLHETPNARAIDQAYVTTTFAKAEQAEEEKRVRVEIARHAREADRLQKQQEYEFEQAQKHQRASAALKQFDDRVGRLENRIELSNEGVVRFEQNTNIAGPDPQSIEDMIAELRILQSRIRQLEKVAPAKRKTFLAKTLPIDQTMQGQAGLTPETEKTLILGVIAVVGTVVLVMLIYWILSLFSGSTDIGDSMLGETPVVVQTVEDPETTVIRQADPQASIVDAQPDPSSEVADEDCSQLATFSNQTECRNRQSLSRE